MRVIQKCWGVFFFFALREFVFVVVVVVCLCVDREYVSHCLKVNLPPFNAFVLFLFVSQHQNALVFSVINIYFRLKTYFQKKKSL